MDARLGQGQVEGEDGAAAGSRGGDAVHGGRLYQRVETSPRDVNLEAQRAATGCQQDGAVVSAGLEVQLAVGPLPLFDTGHVHRQCRIASCSQGVGNFLALSSGLSLSEVPR